jgi:putative heme-binding domain-containing protein
VKLLVAFFIPLALYCQTDTSLEQGKAVFRSNCAFCHGLTGTGGRGPNLVTSLLTHQDSDDPLKRVIKGGVPGTTMPSFSSMPDDETSNLVAYLRVLAKGSAPQGQAPGDPVRGRQIYASSGCAGCHSAGDEGSIFGPDLSRVGAGRSLEYLRESIVNPSADIPEEFAGVTVVLKDGKRVGGVRLNEDTFTVQLREPSQKIRMYSKDELRDVVHEKKSLMPPYNSLSQDDLQNLIAYLSTLRGPKESTAIVEKAKGIR